ncbi:UNVERIFIED_CONTAM: hypothetical protein FKN15_046170 [Acipenser sinensis]
MQAALPCLQPFPVFPDFLKDVQSSWNHPASAPSVVKRATPLASLESERALGLAEFPPVDSTIAVLVQVPSVEGLSKDPACPNAQCRVTEVHLKKAYTVEAQGMCLTNTTSLLMAYLDGILQLAPLPEPVALELRIVSGTLLQISSCQGQALGRSLASLVVACRQLWLSQARVPDADKLALLDAPISPGHIFGPVVEEILPSRASVRDGMRRWHPPMPRTVTRTVPIPTAP